MAATFTVEHPAELLTFLFDFHPDVKRTKVRQWLKHGSVQVNGQTVTRANQLLQTEDVVSILPKGEVIAHGNLAPGMKVVFEDASVIVIEKPESLLSIATETEREKTAYAFLTDYVRRGNPHQPDRVWVVHRLDREVSGLMVFAKTEAAKQSLQARWSESDKRYFAVVEGAPPAEQGVLRSHLDESQVFKVYSSAPNERTRHAVTDYRLIRRLEKVALLELTLETGRRNQIRVHLADAGCPIVGDKKYGARTNPAKRLALHACSLQFAHPLTGEVLKFESPLPKELARLV